ncbi:RNA methyltransferase [Conexibacter sp. CPCC 206217]|uniref:TrmH family RNA methyltransferase n=1 Tax=Conexibacter sp. CPCC 206217 TaxID=3064574 RepID=UPI00271CC00E|nr:RNA methyltransferase [Conexibacter sp. CPCC 206217]MDO8212849.1 RNA methyltransferase [Conexibacter sp. CPCC 206217]
MPPITSPQNERLKDVRRLARKRGRDELGRFVAEGEDLLAAADAAGWRALERFCATGSGLGGAEVEADVLAHVSQLGSGTRALAVYEQRWAPAPTGPLAVYLHGITDPGNVGTVLRSALAFGAACVVFGPGCADPFGPKAVRASMGALFQVPIARADSVAELPGTTIALDAHGTAGTLQGPLREDATLLIGAERAGLPPEVLAACDRTVRIPIRSESLNAAMAATIALYEATRGDSALDHRMGAA